MKKFIILFLFIFANFAFGQNSISNIITWDIPSGKVVKVEAGCGERIYPTNKIPYITNGLIAYWDGIWNAGLGVHNSDATVWKDLVGTRDLTLTDKGGWTNNAFVCKGSKKAAYNNDDLDVMKGTIEVICKANNASSCIVLGITGTPSNSFMRCLFAFVNHNNSYYVQVCGLNNQSNPAKIFATSNDLLKQTLLSSVFTNLSFTGFYNAEKIKTKTNNEWSFANFDSTISVGGRKDTNYTFNGNVYIIRIYNRQLSEEEIKYNAAIDALRFDNPELCYDDYTYGITKQCYRKNTWTDKKMIWPSIPYNTNGLIAMWDGIWNAGLGEHSNSTNVWIDLSTNHFNGVQRQATGWHWTNNAYIGETQSGQGFTIPVEFSSILNSLQNNHTIEIITSSGSNKRMTLFGQFNGNTSTTLNFEKYNDANQSSRAYYGGAPNLLGGTLPIGIRNTFTILSTSTNVEIYHNGKFENSTTWPTTVPAKIDENFIIGGEPSRSTMSLVGEICAIRIYDRPLTSEEIKQHALIDAIRFDIPYDYGKDAWSWIDLSDPRTLYKDFECTERAAIGEMVVGIKDKVNPNNVWSSSCIRVKGGLTSTNYDKVNGVMYPGFLLQTNVMLNGGNAQLTNEFAMCVIYKDDLGPLDSEYEARIVMPRYGYRVFALSYFHKQLRFRQYSTSDSMNILVTPDIRRSNGTHMAICTGKGLGDGTSVFTVKYDDGRTFYSTNNVNVVSGYQPGGNLIPSIIPARMGALSFLPVTYVENLWWDHIPDNLDEITETLLIKHKIKYPYYKDAWSWIDLNDEKTLWSDTDRTIPAEIGDTVLRVDDKALSGNTWISNMKRDTDGLIPQEFLSSGYSTNVMLYQSQNMYPAGHDYSNCEFAVICVITNDRGLTLNPNVVSGRIMQPEPYEPFRLLWMNKIIYFDALNSNGNTNPSFYKIDYGLRKKLTGKSAIFATTVKVVDGVQTTHFSINGTPIIDETTQVRNSAKRICPSVCSLDVLQVIPANYLEVIWWKEIPEDWDKIERALIKKYNIESL